MNGHANGPSSCHDNFKWEKYFLISKTHKTEIRIIADNIITINLSIQ